MDEKIHILVIEDNQSLCYSLRNIFEDEGYRVTTTYTGEEGMAALCQNPVDIVLLDIRLPDTQGSDLLPIIHETNPDIPVIFMTAYASLASAIQALHLGAYAYLLKPLDMDALLAIVRRALEQQRLVEQERQLILQLQQAKDELEARVAERTAELLAVNDRLREEIAERVRLSNQLIHAQETERKRLSQELHDEVGQVLTAMHINLAVIEKALPHQMKHGIEERFRETSDLVDQMLRKVREMSLDLRPSLLDDLGLASTIRWYVSQFANRLMIPVKLEIIGLEERVPPQLEIAAYRIVQEAMTNIARHAGAGRVFVRLENRDSALTVLIEDDGRGFEFQTAGDVPSGNPGTGLWGIKERAVSLGGTAKVESQPGAGVRLYVEIPLAGDSQ